MWRRRGRGPWFETRDRKAVALLTMTSRLLQVGAIRGPSRHAPQCGHSGGGTGVHGRASLRSSTTALAAM
jgi:hypothetical protein